MIFYGNIGRNGKERKCPVGKGLKLTYLYGNQD
jgi:hypothetical protein